MQRYRQWADSRFMEYGDFWRFAFKAHNDLGFRKLYATVFGNKRLQAKIAALHREQKAFKIKFSNSPIFKSAAYRGHEIQDDYFWYLVKEVQARHPLDWKARVSEQCYGYESIPVEFLKRARLNLA